MCTTCSADTELSNVASCGLLAILEEKLDTFEVSEKTQKPWFSVFRGSRFSPKTQKTKVFVFF